MSELREFKVAFQQTVVALSSAPEGFTRADLGRRLGAQYGNAGKDRDRLLGYVDRYVRDGLLDRIGRGRFKAAERFADENALGIGVQLEQDIRDAFVQAGGVMSMKALLTEVGRDGDSTLVRRILTASSAYVSDSPFAGYKTAWRIVDAKRLDVPLPGHLLAFEILTLTGGSRSKEMPTLLRERRRRIGAALGEAREFSGMAVEDVVKIPAIANTLDAALRCCDGSIRPDGSKPTTVEAWWRDLRALDSPGVALETVWEALEAGDVLQVATTVRFWCAVGTTFKVSPSHLSRGCTAPMT